MYTMTPDYYREYIAHDIYTLSNLNGDEYLEHFGVKGMKWGHRKERTSYGVGRRKNGRKGLTDEQKKKLKRVAIGVGVAAGIGAAAYGGYKLNKKIVKNLTAKDMRNAISNRELKNEAATRALRSKMKYNTLLDKLDNTPNTDKSVRKILSDQIESEKRWHNAMRNEEIKYKKLQDFYADRALYGKYSNKEKASELYDMGKNLRKKVLKKKH